MIKLRAHHLLCLSRFKGGGYNKKIREKIRKIQNKIKKNPNVIIHICRSIDDICISCPFINQKRCEKKEDINKDIKLQDQNVLKFLKIKNNQKIKAKDIILLLNKKIKNEELKRICKGCEFLPFCIKYGMNKSLMKKTK